VAMAATSRSGDDGVMLFFLSEQPGHTAISPPGVSPRSTAPIAKAGQGVAEHVAHAPVKRPTAGRRLPKNIGWRWPAAGHLLTEGTAKTVPLNR